MDFAMRSPPRPSRGDSGLSLVSPSHMLTVVLPGGPVDLSDSADTRETVHQLPRESLEDIVLALRDRVAQDSRGEARRPARRRSSLTLGRASFSVSTGSADDILGVSQAERMLEQIRQLQAQLDGATQEVADRDEIIEDLQAQLRDTEPSGESPAARSGKLRGSELELLGTLQERDRMLSEADSTLRGYADALRARDDLVQKTSRMLAAERRRVADLQAVYAAQARRLHEAEAAIAAMVAAGAPPPAAARADADADMLMLRCATCLQMIAADRLDVHAGECAAACRRLAETKQMLQVQVADPVATGGGELTVKVMVRTDIAAFGGGAFEVRRSVSDFVWLQAALQAHHPASIVPPLSVLPAGAQAEPALNLAVAGLQRFLARIAGHPVLRRSSHAVVFLSGSNELLRDMAAQPLPADPPAAEADTPAEPDHLLDRTKRILGLLQDALEDLDQRLDRQASASVHGAEAEQSEGQAFGALAACEPGGSPGQQVAQLFSAVLGALATARSDDVEALLHVKDAIRSLADYAGAAAGLVARLETSMAAAAALAAALAADPADADLCEKERAAARLAEAIGDRIWDELQTFEARKCVELRALCTDYAAMAVQQHQLRMCKWSGLLQALATIAT
eukprot:m.128174 g.128174  ORF g.128174 m.128174 type:complete len:627 (+) comp9407_c1_seq4:201-2081(+)